MENKIVGFWFSVGGFVQGRKAIRGGFSYDFGFWFVMAGNF